MKILAGAKVLLPVAILFSAVTRADDSSLVPKLCLSKLEPSVGELSDTV